MNYYSNFFIILLIIAISCNGQIKHSNINKIGKMEIFDIKKFKENNINGEYSFHSKDRTVVRQIENKNSSDYTEEVRNLENPFVILKLFFMDSGQLKAKGEKFYSFPIGKWQYFDKTGTLIKETNWDADYKFTINDLSKKMQKLGVNIMKQKVGVNVHRASVGVPLYIVSYPINSLTPYDIYELKIDGITGDIKEKTTQHIRN
jgi:hypothetical protein